MNPSARLEQDLTDWLRETAVPNMPDYADDILAETSRTRQRRPWTFVGRWLPLGSVGRSVPFAGHGILRGVALLVVLGLILVAVATFVGGRRTVPPPFGLAGNGLLAHELDGRIQLVHPETLATVSVLNSGFPDHDPRWSPDGTRLAFVREVSDGQVVVVADTTGRVLAISDGFEDLDPDAIAWSPDGRQIAIGAARGLDRGIYLVDAVTGTLRGLALAYDSFEPYWRPPDGRQLMFHVGGSQPGLHLFTVAEGTVERLPSDAAGEKLRPLGWMPTGNTFIYQQAVGSAQEWVYVADVETRTVTRLDVAWGHVSNDGTKVAGLDDRDRLCVLTISGGQCRTIPDVRGWIASTSAALTWSPDDRWIAIFASDTRSMWLVDATGATASRRFPSSGTPTWQRIAP